MVSKGGDEAFRSALQMLSATSQWSLAVAAYQRWKTQKIPSLGHLAALLRSGESWRRSLEERCNCEVGCQLMSLVDSVICLPDCGTVEVLTNYFFRLNTTGKHEQTDRLSCTTCDL